MSLEEIFLHLTTEESGECHDRGSEERAHE